jgi:ATP-dependent DNA helicase DinG
VLQSFNRNIDDLAIVYAHAGLKPDQENTFYSVAATIYFKGEKKKEYKSHINYSYFSARDRFYSALSKETLASAPRYQDVKRELTEFLKHQKFIILFDTYGKIDEIIDFCGVERFIDLSLATEFFYPHIGACTSKTVWEFLYGKEREKISFNADEIVELSFKLIKHVCSTILNDSKTSHAPSLRYYLERSGTFFGKFFVHMTESYTEYFGGLFSACNKKNTSDWKANLIKASFPSKNNDNDEKIIYQSISKEQIQDLYSGMSKSGNNFKLRKEQVEFAHHVAESLNSSSVLTIEAGTGTGKTQGYLIPVMEFLYRNKDARIAISTYTKSLQEQIFQRELPFTKTIFQHYRDIPVALLKGKTSYICSEKLDNFLDEDLTGKKLLTWLYFLIILFDFRISDLDSIGERIKIWLNEDNFVFKILNEVSAKDGCGPNHLKCPAQVLAAEASKSRLIITNHHKLALLENDEALSGLFRNYIIDEANLFESAVRNSFGKEIESREIFEIIEYLQQSLKKIEPRTIGEDSNKVKDIVDRIKDLKQTSDEMHYALGQLNPLGEIGQTYELQFDHPAFKKGQIDTLLIALEKQSQKISHLLEIFDDETTCRQYKIYSRTVQRIKRTGRQLADFGENFKTVSCNIKIQNQINAYQVFKKNWVISTHSVDVSGIINNQFYKLKDCIVYTAATLCNNNTFDCFAKITGQNLKIAQPEKKNDEDHVLKQFIYQQIPSPFLKNQMKVYVHERAVSGGYNNKQAWFEAVIDIIPELIRKNKGRTLVLFSSYTDLEQVYHSIGGKIEDEGYPLFIQKQGISTKILCDEFRAIKESVLFGVDSFWYGVDFKGDTLTQVIITRIPYNLPSSPIQLARKRTMSTKDYFERYYFDKNIKLKQGIGRLIRSDTDKGTVVFLDSRYKDEKNCKQAISPNQLPSDSFIFNSDNSNAPSQKRANLNLSDQETTYIKIKKSADINRFNIVSLDTDAQMQHLHSSDEGGSLADIKNRIKTIPISKPHNSFTEKRIIEIRTQYTRAYEPWTDEEDDLLCKAFKKSQKTDELADIFQRQPGAIRSRIKKKDFETIIEETTYDTEKVCEIDSRMMSGYKDIVCFANSHKYNGSCIAGKEFSKNGAAQWVRPVSKRQMGELFISSEQDTDKVFPKVLDVISIPIRKHFPHNYQTENFLIDESKDWISKRSLSISELSKYHDNVETLWINGYNSFGGYNDRIPIDLAFDECTSSLLLIQPEKISINVDLEGNSKKKIRAKFLFNSIHYSFIVTDQVIKNEYINKDAGEYDLNMENVSLCISIGEPWKDFCYKLVAGVIGERN